MEISPEDAKRFVNLARSSGDTTGDFAVGIQQMYILGKSGVPISKAMNSRYGAKLSDTNKRFGYGLGRALYNAQVQKAEAEKKNVAASQRARAATGGTKVNGVQYDGLTVSVGKDGSVAIEGVTLNAQQKAGIQAAEMLAGMGVNIHVFQSRTDANGKPIGEHGSYHLRDGSIHIDLNAGNLGQGMMAYTIAHEFTHFMEQQSPAKFQAFTDALFAELDIDVEAEIERKAEELKRQQPEQYKNASRETLMDDARSEVVAEACETMLTDTDAANRIGQSLKAKDATLFEKVKQWFRDLADKLRKAYKGLHPDSEIAKYAKKTIQQVDGLVQLWSDMAVDAAENYRGAVAKDAGITSDDSMYSIRRTSNMSWGQQIRSALKHNGKIQHMDTLVVMSNTPAYLLTGKTVNLPMAIPLSVITKAQKGKNADHAISDKNLIALQYGMENAIAVIDNPGRNSLAFITSLDEDGGKVAVFFDKNVQFDGDQVNKATSIHRRTNIVGLMNNLSDDATIYVKNKNEFDALVGMADSIPAAYKGKIKFVYDRISHEENSVKLFSDRNDVESEFYNAGVKYSSRVTDKDTLSFLDNQETITTYKTMQIVDGKNSDRDSAYMDAIKRGDMKTAQKMVEQAAKDSGYTRLFYHGSKKGGGFKIFRDWQYFSENKEYAKRYTDRGNAESLYTTYVKMDNPFDTRIAEVRKLFRDARMEYGMGELQENGLPDWTDGYDIADFIEENDLPYDSIVLDEGGDMVNGKPVSRGLSYVIRKSNQIKSADIITYDDSGNVIPLSQRFNTQNNDIRYSNRNQDQQAALEKQNEKLREDVDRLRELLRLQGKTTGGKLFKPESIKTAANFIMRETGRSLDAEGKAEFAGILTKAYTALSDENVTYDDIIVYNKFGDHDPNGLLYVLAKDSRRIQKKARENFCLDPPQPYEEVRPLVLRANVGDEIHVNFRNRLNRRASMHVQGLGYSVLSSDGANVGLNPDTTTADIIQYTWYADREGVFLFSDLADPRSGEEGTNVHGLFGAIIVEAAGSEWFDPVTGNPLESGLFADIYHPARPAFREYAVFFHDELEILNAQGQPPVDPHTGLPSATTAISYRSEPMRNRLPLDPNGDPADIDEDISMSSWAYGDPAPPILKAYVGDPSKIRLIHGGVKETHVFHLHNHQWRREVADSRSTIIDSVSISPQECFTLDILYGAGSLNGMIGDAIFHCHLYPHFHEGMWTLWRVFDRLQQGGDTYPDGTPIDPLQPLRDRPLPPEKDEWHPGYPNFINGIFPQQPSQPPLGILTAEGENKIDPTPLEEANFVPDFAPGALYTSTCPCHAADDVKVFEIAAVQAKLVYNRFGWHDPQGRFFVLKEEIEKYGTLDNYLAKVECGEICPEPLVIRANAGDCIEVRFTNLLPEYIEESPFQMRTLTDIVGYHIHLVKFDTIVSDGSANGWNNIAGARKYETLIERFFANEELHTVFFHDHLFANMHQQHGLFGALIVEPAGAEYLDPHTLCPIRHGTKAVIRRKDGTAFREFALFLHDFALLFDGKGNPLNPPEQPGSHDDPGVMGINYRCEPMPERLKYREDPSHIFSSLAYWDPATPILETYPGDELVIRLLDGAHEEQHAFNIVGMSWKKEITNPDSPLVEAQTIGISEAFNLQIEEPYAAGDYLYYSGSVDDVWLGLWGIIRAYAQPQDCLLPLCGKRENTLLLTPPPGAKIRRFEIAAIQKDLEYNRYGDHDPDGLLFVPLEDAEDICRGRKRPIPLILRANAGDWIEVTLHNLFEKEVPYFDYPSVPLDLRHRPSSRVSLNPQFLRYDPVMSSGLNVGYNDMEQTAAPGKRIRYLWHADKEYGTCLIRSFGDLRNHKYHGLFGAIIIEPPGAKYYRTFAPVEQNHEAQSVITAPGVRPFREFVLFAHNGIRILDKEGNLIKTTETGEPHGAHGEVDHEDTGEKGFNYRSERFYNRLKRIPLVFKLFDSKVHGDPATPVLTAYTGERVIIRYLMPGDKPRNIGFLIHGHEWLEQPDNPLSNVEAVKGAISVGNVYNLELLGGASDCPGDYLYRSGSLRWDVESGMWGIFRVKMRTLFYHCASCCRNVGQWWEKVWKKT